MNGGAVEHELEVLVEQLDKILTEPIVDIEDAFEVAVVAGLAARLGASVGSLAEAQVWRDSAGKLLLDEVWEQVDEGPLIEALDACTEGASAEAKVEDSLYDVDDLIAAAVWCQRRDRVQDIARQALNIVQFVPDVFAPFAEVAGRMSRLPSIARDLDLYGYWLAVADAKDLS
jgi:hypothetical protein